MASISMSLKELHSFISNSSGLEGIVHDCSVFSDKPESPELFSLLKEGKASIEYMSPDEYLSECKKMQKYEKSMKNYINEVVNPDLVNAYYKDMMKGSKFPIVMIDYSSRLQEGRHRVLAAKKCKVTKVPVIVIR